MSSPRHDPRAAADPVVLMARVLGAMDGMRAKLAARSLATTNHRMAETDALYQAEGTACTALEALRHAISYLPAASPTGALIHLALGNIAAEDARSFPGEGDGAERVQRHIEAALPVLVETLGIDLEPFVPGVRPILLSALLRETYLAEVCAPLAAVFGAEDRP